MMNERSKPTLSDGYGSAPSPSTSSRRALLRMAGRGAGILAVASLADALAPAPAAAQGAQSAVNIAAPLDGSDLLGTHLAFSFSTSSTCDRNERPQGLTERWHDVVWGYDRYRLDGTYLETVQFGKATVREGISVQQIYRMPPGLHRYLFWVQQDCAPSRAAVKFTVNSGVVGADQKPDFSSVQIAFPVDGMRAARGQTDSPPSHGLLSFFVTCVNRDLTVPAFGPFKVTWGVDRQLLGSANAYVGLSVQQFYAIGPGSHSFWVDAGDHGYASHSYTIG